MFEPTPKQFGVFWEFIENPTVTDITMDVNYGLLI